MRKLGLIGGTGPESTIEYYRQIEYAVLGKTGAFPNLVIESLSVLMCYAFVRRGIMTSLSIISSRDFGVWMTQAQTSLV